MIIMNADERFCTDTPCACTAAGSCGSARLTRFCTSTCASEGTVPISKKIVRFMLPVDEVVEYMYSMLSAPLTCCSMGAATLFATTSALAPGYVAETVMVGGVMSGYCAIGRFTIATAPASVMTIEITAAKIGRSMQKCEMFIGAVLR